MLRRARIFRAWACYWLMSALGRLPRRWWSKWPIEAITAAIFPYAGWWALSKNQNLSAEQKRQMGLSSAGQQDTGGADHG